MLLGIIQGHALLQVGAGGGQLAEMVQGIPQRAVGHDEERGVLEALRQAEELLSQLLRRLVLCPRIMKVPQPPQHREELRGFPHLLAQLPCPGVDALRLPGRVNPLVYINAVPRVIWKSSSCCVRSGVSGRVVSSSSPLVRCPMASRLAERWMARWPARCQ